MQAKKDRLADGFTLVELMVVVAILALLFMMLLPSLQNVAEEGRINNCGRLMHNIGSAMTQYISDNHGVLPPAVTTDQDSYDYLLSVVVTDQYGNVWNPTYQSNYIYRNLIGVYLGLGSCMPGHRDNYWPQYLKWEGAMYSHFAPFICPSGTNVTSPYGWAVSPTNGRSEGNCYYAQNVSWSSQSARIYGAEWPRRSAYYPLFKDTSSAILLFEQWSCNGGSLGGNDTMGQPYSTHYKNGPKGAQGIGRNIIYVDGHGKFLRTGPADDQPFLLHDRYPAVRRGNDMGVEFKDQWQGRTYIAWDLHQSLKEKG